MAPKGKKAVAPKPSKKSRTFDSHLYVSADASDRHDASILSRNCIQERGIQNPTGSVQTQIVNRKWETFVAHPEAALVPVVREFYANVLEHKNLKAWVRGKWVAFDRTTINKVYNLPDIPNNEYSRMLDEGVDYDDLLQVLASEGAEWEIVDEVMKRFPAKYLYVTGKLWHYFISAKLMPTTNISAVSRERAILNYAIQTGLSVDVGEVIEQSILQLARVAKGGFGHPSLIYELCLRARVATSPSEEIQRPKPPITKKSVKPPVQSATESRTEKTTVIPSSSRQGKQLSYKATISALRNDVHTLSQQVMARQDRISLRQDLQYNHLLQMIKASHQAGTSQPQYPEPPVLPPYPPEAVEHDEEEQDDDNETTSEASEAEENDSESDEATEEDEE